MKTNMKTEFKEQLEKIEERMKNIKYKVAILSGKGGVGKSTITANLAVALASRGRPNLIGVLDADITGPSIPKILGVRGGHLNAGPAGIFPVFGPLGIKVVSMDFLLPSDETPVIWRGPLKSVAIRQFLSDVVWGELEYLLIDLPPGTGDEALSIMQFIPKVSGVIIITIPSEVSQLVVKKAVTFTHELKAPIVGIIENMSGFVCPNCGSIINIFKVGGGEKIAEELKVPFLGKIPLDPRICETSDDGIPFIVKHPNTPASKSFMDIVEKIENFFKNKEEK